MTGFLARNLPTALASSALIWLAGAILRGGAA